MFNLDPSTFIVKLVLLLIAFPVHELAHAYTADYFGDDTPRLHGRLNPNPLVHLDVIGSLLLLLYNFGWAKPVPINPYALQRRSSAAVMLVSLAGPLSNLGMAVLAAIPFRLGLVSAAQAQMDLFTSADRLLPTIPQVLWLFIYINLILLLFNLIPVAPLDGEKIIAFFLPPGLQRTLETIRPYGPIILLAIVFLGALDFILGPPLSFMIRLLVG